MVPKKGHLARGGFSGIVVCMQPVSVPLLVTFISLGTVFALLHLVAMQLFLYWQFWWFDVLMHTLGGIWIVLGVHVLAQLPTLPVRATYPWILGTLFVATISWEVFELSFGLYDPSGYVVDATQDILLAFLGGLLTHYVVERFRMQ